MESNRLVVEGKKGQGYAGAMRVRQAAYRANGEPETARCTRAEGRPPIQKQDTGRLDHEDLRALNDQVNVNSATTAPDSSTPCMGQTTSTPCPVNTV